MHSPRRRLARFRALKAKKGWPRFVEPGPAQRNFNVVEALLLAGQALGLHNGTPSLPVRLQDLMLLAARAAAAGNLDSQTRATVRLAVGALSSEEVDVLARAITAHLTSFTKFGQPDSTNEPATTRDSKHSGGADKQSDAGADSRQVTG
jgi:hypothetical protein